MITTVTLNPCIDRTIYVNNLQVGGYNRVENAISHVSGKGINVSMVLKALGIETGCLCLEHDKGGNLLREKLIHAGISMFSVKAEGELRTNIKLMDAESGSMTELNEKGTHLQTNVLEAFRKAYEDILPQTDLVVLDGSVPPQVPENIYAELIQKAKEKGIPSILDASGELLRIGIAAKPWMIKPNRYELEQLLGKKLNTLSDVKEAALSLLRNGIETICISLGAEGAMLATNSGVFFSEGIPIHVQGFQGAGDSMVAGVCASRMHGLSNGEMLRWGVAAAHASLILPGTELCTKEGFTEMLKKIPVSEIA